MPQLRISHLLICLYLQSVAAENHVDTPSSASSVVDPSLQQKYLRDPSTKVDIIVGMKAGVSKAHQQIESSSYKSRPEKITKLKQALQENSAQSQKGVLQFLSNRKVPHESFWISNTIFVPEADSQLVQALEGIANAEGISEIREQFIASLMPATSGSEDGPVGEVAWGVKKIQAIPFWSVYGSGEGITVGIIDSGVMGTHEALKDNFIGTQDSHGWFDPKEKTPFPVDKVGHGTHCLGSAVGSKGIGVAPGSKWLGCLGCPIAKCPESATLSCAEFILCPTDPQGNDPQCGKAPRVVSNSWGDPPGDKDKYFSDAIKAWHMAGIIPIFAAGNDARDGCGSESAPSDTISVGSTDLEDELSYFSSLGPNYRGKISPDITAPGENIWSAGIVNDTAYTYMSGTSMATPHIAGTVALLLGKYPQLGYDDVRRILLQGAEKEGLTGTNSCGGVATFPNNGFGHGRVNVMASAGLVGDEKGKTSAGDPSTSEQHFNVPYWILAVVAGVVVVVVVAAYVLCCRKKKSNTSGSNDRNYSAQYVTIDKSKGPESQIIH